MPVSSWISLLTPEPHSRKQVHLLISPETLADAPVVQSGKVVKQEMGTFSKPAVGCTKRPTAVRSALVGLLHIVSLRDSPPLPGRTVPDIVSQLCY